MTDNIVDRWTIRHMHEPTRKAIAKYAIDHKIGIAQAVKELVELALVTLEDKPEYGVLNSSAFSVAGDLAAARKALNQQYLNNHKKDRKK